MDRLLSEQELLKHFDPREDWVVVQTIKAIPSVEPCDDAISREWLKTAIHNFYYGLKHIPTEEDIQAYIDVAPSVKPQEPKWIPVSEPPKELGTYLIQTDGEPYMCQCRWTDVNPFWTDYKTKPHWNIFDLPQYSNVVAWMPLPKPYEPQEGANE